MPSLLPVKTAVIGAGGNVGHYLWRSYRCAHPDCVGTSFSHPGDGLTFFDMTKIFKLALADLVEFLGDKPLTERISNLENALAGARVDELAPILQAHSVQPDNSCTVRAKTELGRVNDLIHALAISLSLPHLMEPGEVLRRPSLASGNDPSRLFDLETDRRIAEFKLSDGKVATQHENDKCSKISFIWQQTSLEGKLNSMFLGRNRVRIPAFSDTQSGVFGHLAVRSEVA